MAETNNNWRSLFKFSGVAAVIFIVYSLATMVLLVVIGGQPETAAEAFDMLNGNKLVALLRLDILTLLVMPFYYLIFLSIYIALRKTNMSLVTLGTLLSVAGVTLFLATPSVFSWVALSDKFSAATTDLQRERLLAAGEAILASDMWHGSGAVLGGILMLGGILIVSVVMLQSQNFGKATAYLGIVTHGLDLSRMLIGLFAPQASFILMAIAGPLYLIWFPLLARDFFRLSSSFSKS